MVPWNSSNTAIRGQGAGSTRSSRLNTYLLTPWSRVLLEKPTGFAANQEIPCILWNPKVHYRTHKRPPPFPILSQLHPVPTTPSHFLKIHLIIILPPMFWSPQRSLSLITLVHSDQIVQHVFPNLKRNATCQVLLGLHEMKNAADVVIQHTTFISYIFPVHFLTISLSLFQ